MTPHDPFAPPDDDAEIIEGARACSAPDHSAEPDGLVITRIARATRGLTEAELEGFLRTLAAIGRQVGDSLAPVGIAAAAPTLPRPRPRALPCTARASLAQLISHPQLLQAVGAAVLGPVGAAVPAGDSLALVPIAAYLDLLAHLARRAAAELREGEPPAPLGEEALHRLLGLLAHLPTRPSLPDLRQVALPLPPANAAAAR